MQAYDRRFYDLLSDTAQPSARIVLPIVLELAPIASAVDLGCGNGGWLSVLHELGVEDVLGLDGDWVALDQLRIARERFRRVRLDAPIDLDRRFDLAISLEVAEHLPPERASGFVATLCDLAPLVLFSAAIPDQGGLNHVNEQWPAYWAALFQRHGYRPIDVIRPAVWENPAVTWWYKQNLLLFADPAAIAASPPLAAAAARSPAVPPALVHPELYTQAVRSGRPSLGRWLRMAPAALARSRAKSRAR
ncbi:MAG: class I SAM-dependent methyltransferase [Alphaproteobacteria bacterium]